MDDNTIQTELKKFNVTDAALTEIKSKYGSLIISGIDDKEGYKFVNEARKIVKSKRVEVEGRRKELKADSLKFGRAVDAEAKRITNELRGVEYHLEQQKNIIDCEKKRIADEEKERVRIAKEEEHKRNLEEAQRKIDAFSKFDVRLTVCDALLMTDNAFNERIKESEQAYKKHAEEKERERLLQFEMKEREEQEESKRLVIEREKLEKERKELEDQKKDLQKEKEFFDEKNTFIKTPLKTIADCEEIGCSITENEQVNPVESLITGVGAGVGVIIVDDPCVEEALKIELSGTQESIDLLRFIIFDNMDEYDQQGWHEERNMMENFLGQIKHQLGE